MRASGGLRVAGLGAVAGGSAGGAGRRRGTAGNVDASAQSECRDEGQRANDVVQVDAHRTFILAIKLLTRESAKITAPAQA